MHINRLTPALYGSLSNSWFKNSAEEPERKLLFIFVFLCSSFSFFRIPLGQAARENVQLPGDFQSCT